MRALRLSLDGGRWTVRAWTVGGESLDGESEKVSPMLCTIDEGIRLMT